MTNFKDKISLYILPILALLCLLPIINPAVALVLGIVAALIIGNPYQSRTENLSKTLLAVCIIGLGGDMNLTEVLNAGASGFVYTALGITMIMALGYALMRAFKLNHESSLLISVGTAICGGSAIAAIAPVINAKSANIAVSLVVVFALNALALIIFPEIGAALDLSQYQFGLWSALAIHDTSSVVGAGVYYGSEALQTGTSVKLARALWIIPMVFAVQFFWNQNNNSNQPNDEKPPRKYPWFILGFVAAAALVTCVPVLQETGEFIAQAARRVLVLTLFLIGASLNLEMLRSVGIKPFLFGGVLWAMVASISLWVVYYGII